MMQHMFICDETQDIGNREISKLLIIDPIDQCIRNDGRKTPNPNDITRIPPKWGNETPKRTSICFKNERKFCVQIR